MIYVGVLVVIATFYAIIKKYEARMVLFAAGLVMCLCAGNIQTLITSVSNTMVHKTLVPTICTVMGFSYVMKYTKCDKHLVTAISSVITKAKIILVPMAVLITWWINIPIPSAAGCSAAVGSILIPTMIAAGVHPAMAASAVMAGTWGSAISPGTSHNPVVAKLAGTDVMTVIMNEAPAAIITSFIVVVCLTAISVFMKEGPSEERRQAYIASNDAAALAFNNAITPHAEQFGMTIMNLGSMAQMTGAIGRSMSPVAGAAIICAQLAGVNPMEITKRNGIPMLVGVISFLCLF